MASRLMFVGLLSALSLSACAYDDGYGYGGMSAGAGYYAGDYYGPAGYGPGGFGGGWYNDFYYPGTGYYVFDRGGRRHRWNDGQRRYWETRRQHYRGQQQAGRPDWNRDGVRDGRRDGRDGRDGRWRDGDRSRNYDRAVDRTQGRDGRGFEGQRGRPPVQRVEGAVAQPPVRQERPAYRERPQRQDNPGARMERRQAEPRSTGGPARSRGFGRRAPD